MPNSEELFGAAWDELSLEHVRSFLADAGEEGLTWEAKGGEFGAHIVRKAVCGFANSERGGVLILGVGGNARTGWVVEGMAIDDEEPEARVGRVLRSGVSPWPEHRVRAFELDGRHVVVVEVEPVAVPPTVTSQGQVYERVSSETLPVKDPVRLAALFARGDAARAAAEANAVKAAQVLVDPEPEMREPVIIAVRESEQAGFGLAISATAYRDDIGAALFSAGFHEAVEAAAVELRGLPHNYPGGFARPFEGVYRQDATFIRGEAPTAAGYPAVLGIGGFWNGTCGAAWISTSTDVSLGSMLEHKVAPAWRHLVALVQRLGGSGPGRLALAVPGSPRLYEGPGDEEALVQRHIELRAPNAAELESVLRELRRAGGWRQDEPGPPAG